jgi:hypothetical protein
VKFGFFEAVLRTSMTGFCNLFSVSIGTTLWNGRWATAPAAA